MPAKKKSQGGVYALRLYVADNSPRSILALSNLTKLCEQDLAGRYRIEVIDIVKNPQMARADQILAVPTLVRKLPPPARRFIGNLSDPERVRIAFELGLSEAPESAARK